MNVLVMGDCHLKPWMFKRAEELMQEYCIETLVFLGDLVDDWKKQYSIEAYVETMNTAIDFYRRHPKSIYIIGNHDISYLWQKRETGYSPIASRTVIEKFEELKNVLPENNQPNFIRRVDNCIFCHGGFTDSYIYYMIENYNLPVSIYKDIDSLIDIINKMDASQLWQSSSPLWYRPQYYDGRMYGEKRGFLQVVGHTPVRELCQKGNVLSCDVFSTENDGRTPIGTEMFVLFNTVSLEWKGIK